MHNEFAKCEIKTSVFSGRKSQAGNYWISFVVSIVRSARVGKGASIFGWLK